MDRLTRRADFRAAARGKRTAASGFVLQTRARGDHGVARVGFTVSRQIGNAVERNRVRRRLREMVRLAAEGEMRNGHDYVLIGRRAALALPFAQMRQELDAALTRIHSSEPQPQRGDEPTGDPHPRSLHETRSPRPNSGRKPRHG